MHLSDVAIRNAKPKEKPIKLFDGDGLYLLVSPGGSRLWRLKYRIAGREKLISLGSYPEVSLKAARARRDECAPWRAAAQHLRLTDWRRATAWLRLRTRSHPAGVKADSWNRTPGNGPRRRHRAPPGQLTHWSYMMVIYAYDRLDSRYWIRLGRGQCAQEQRQARGEPGGGGASLL